VHAGFGFADAARIAEYLAALGVTHLYCSPYLQAAAGSTHGYDVVDPRRLNEELGGAAAHAEMTGTLRAHGLGQVLDIVPNHMATDPGNEFWWDVLENGPSSRYARFFDIDWDGASGSAGLKAAFRVLAPILGDHYGRVLDAGEVQVQREGGSFVVRYFEHRLPVSPRTIDELLGRAARRAGSAPLARLAEEFASLPLARLADAEAVAERHDHKIALATALDRLLASEPDVAAAVDAEAAALEGDPDRLDALLQRQNSRLAFWRTASEELDYRRFFNIDSLVGLRVEDPEVFATTHSLVLDLVADGTIEGLRIDHVDGLREPRAYLEHLAVRTAGAYTVVEKILEPGEALPSEWPVAGTSGYDFLIRANNLFVVPENEGAMTEGYAGFTGETASYAEVVYEAKQQVMGNQLAAEVERLTGMLAEICDGERRHRDHTRRDLRAALREVVAHFPVYRTYVEPGRAPSDADRRHVAIAVDAAVEHAPSIDTELLRFIGTLALGERPDGSSLELALRLQQLTAPVTAKGVEDTAFYRYNRLVSLNEVGGDPATFGRGPASFHEATAAAAAHWPDSMLTLSTHDTKRSIDVRARIDALSELPETWLAAVERWAERNATHEHGWHDRNAQHLLYQTIVGAWPLDADRAVAFMLKAQREARVHTSWVDPDEAYEQATEAFVRSVLADEGFVADLQAFLADERIVERGRRNSLAQTTLLLTCPGVPDLYQGTELWDLSLVDPDNRRPVDYAERHRLLARLAGAEAGDALAAGASGGTKLWLIHRLLHHRAAHPERYQSSLYEPLAVGGPEAGRALAFQRGDLAVVVPRFISGDPAKVTVTLPGGRWRDVLTGANVEGGHRPLGQLLAGFPVSVLEAEGRGHHALPSSRRRDSGHEGRS
jgi:(1->4)-alpha-D-glucan 1-alpha-D-glucosylmutase